MELKLSRCTVRSWRLADVESLAYHANNLSIWLNLRDRFPYPYMMKDAREFIRSARQQNPETLFCIDVGGEAGGGIGFLLQSDVERVSSEIGYWVAQPFWGRGIATEALAAVTRYAIEHHNLTRVFALPFESNVASCRVLEKAGFVLEGRLRRSAIKDGVIRNQRLYAFVADTTDPVLGPSRPGEE